MPFVDTRLPINVEQGATGGPAFNVNIITGRNTGRETRKPLVSVHRGFWDLSYGWSEDEFKNIQAFFYERGGPRDSFVFRDWSDFMIGNPEFTGDFQAIGVGDAIQTDFVVNRIYTTYVRPNILIDPVGARAYVDGVEDVGATFNRTTRMVTLTSPPALAAIVQAACYFEVPVRFFDANLDVTIFQVRAGRVPSVPVIEVIGEI